MQLDCTLLQSKAHLFHNHLSCGEANLDGSLNYRMNKFLHSSLNSWTHKLLQMGMLLKQWDLQEKTKNHVSIYVFVTLKKIVVIFKTYGDRVIA